MKILLVVPRYVYTNLGTDVNYNYAFPIGLGYISAVLKKEGYDVDCINLNHLHGTVKDIINKKLDNTKYDFVCSGHMGLGYAVIDLIINTVHAHSSNPQVIIGGALITAEAPLMAKSLKFDYGVLGEGEETIIELLKCLEKKKDLSKVDGICYRDKEGKPIFTKPRKLIEDLDSLPFPDYESLGLKEQLDHMNSNDVFYCYLDKPRCYQLLGSRSCPFQCTFCYHSIGSKYRERSIKNIIQEIKQAVEKYNINCISINDDLFAANKDRLKEFCREIKKIKKQVPELVWHVSLWVSTVDKEILELMKDAGCWYIGFGFESYSSTVLRSMKKGITPAQIDRAVKLCREVSIATIGGFIFGDPVETRETAKVTINYWKKNCSGMVKLFFIHPYPGSEIFNYCIKKGIIQDKLDYIKNKIHHTNIVNMTSLSEKEFKNLVSEIWEAKAKYEKYIVPSKIKRTKNKIYNLRLKCPHCSFVTDYNNIFIYNKNYFTTECICRRCSKRFFIVSKLYKFTIDHYVKLDFLRKKYLAFRDRFVASHL